mgnify:CR=1 FL=1
MVKKIKTEINKEKVYKRYKQDKNRGIRLSMALILAVYAFFFLSPYIFHQSSKSNYTPLNTEYTIGKTSISIEDWKYSKKQRRMEIILNINNFSSEIIDYKYYAYCNFKEASKGKTQLKIEEKIKEINYAVIWVYNIPNDFNGCAVLLFEGDTNGKNITIQTSKDEVSDAKEINLKTVEEYHITKYENSIVELNKSIEKEKESIKNAENDIEQYNKMIKESQKTELYQSEREIAKTENLISSYRGKIDGLKSNIEESNKQIDNYKKEITKYQELIAKIKKKEG